MLYSSLPPNLRLEGDSGFRLAFFDIEADGLKPTVVHCLVITDADSGRSLICRTDRGVQLRLPADDEGVYVTLDIEPNLRGYAAIQYGVDVLQRYTTIVAHNAVGYDYPVLRRLHGLTTPFEAVRDSLVLARLLFGHVKEAVDFELAIRTKEVRNTYRLNKMAIPDHIEHGLFPGQLIGSHSLEAWGRRLGLHKGDYAKSMEKRGLDPWATVNDEMVEYCFMDTRVLIKLWNDLIKPRLLGLIMTFRVPLEVRIKYESGGEWRERNLETELTIDGSSDGIRAQANSEEGYHLGNEIAWHVEKTIAAFAEANYVKVSNILLNGVKLLALPGFSRHWIPIGIKGHVLVRIPHAKKLAEQAEQWTDTGPAADGLQAIRREMHRRASQRRKELLETEALTDKLFGGVDRTKEVHVSRTASGTSTQVLKTLEGIKLWGLGPTAKKAIRIEHDMAQLMQELEEEGVHLDLPRAEKLREELETRRAGLEKEIKEFFKPQVRPKKWVYITREDSCNAGVQRPGLLAHFPEQSFYNPKYERDMGEKWHREAWGGIRHVRKRKGYTPQITRGVDLLAADPTLSRHYKAMPDVAEGDCTPIVWEECNINSRTQLAARLMALGWTPTAFTATGLPELSDAALEVAARTYPVAEKLRVFFLVEKRLGMLIKGKQAWLRLVDAEGKLHPRINPLGAITMRATHSNPNVSQVTAMKKVKKWLEIIEGMKLKDDEKKEKRDGVWHVEKEVVAWGEEGEWGADCRALFTVPSGWKMVGVDLSKLELCCFAHYLGDYDGGAFARLLLSVDVHEVNRVILGFANRHDAKRFIFALLYGAGDEKLGEIYDPTATPAQKKAYGSQFRKRLMEGVEGFAALVQAVRDFAATGTLPTIDGRLVVVRAIHAALNTLLQSLGAIIAKYWIVRGVQRLERLGLTRGWKGEYTLLIWSHDEIQVAVKDIPWTGEDGKVSNLPEIVRNIFLDSATQAGVELGLNLPISADGRIGANWFETH